MRQDNAKSSGNSFNRITIRPIAGTRRRGKTEREDADLERNYVRILKSLQSTSC